MPPNSANMWNGKRVTALTVTLIEGLTYKIHGHEYRKNIPERVTDPNMIRDLLYDGHFDRAPELLPDGITLGDEDESPTPFARAPMPLSGSRPDLSRAAAARWCASHGATPKRSDPRG